MLLFLVDVDKYCTVEISIFHLFFFFVILSFLLFDGNNVRFSLKTVTWGRTFLFVSCYPRRPENSSLLLALVLALVHVPLQVSLSSLFLILHCLLPKSLASNAQWDAQFGSLELKLSGRIVVQGLIVQKLHKIT